MKKLIFVLFATTFILISFLSIKQFEFLQFQNFNYHPTNEIWDVVIESGNKDLNKADNFTLLTDMTNEAKINLQRESYESNDKGEDKLVYYVSLSDTDTYYADIKLASGNYIDNESNENEYISTIATNDKNQIGKIELFHSFDPIEIRPMIAAQNTRDIKGSYTITSGGDPKQFEHLGLSNGFSIEVSRNTSQVMFSQYPYNEILYQTTIILCLLIMLAMFYDISNNYKEVAVRYLLGYNFPEIGGYILKRYWITIVSSLLLVYIGLMLFLFIYNGYQQLGDFLVYWLKNMESLFVLIIILFLFTWLATWKISIPNMIKNKKPIKLTLNLTILTRLVLALILVLTLEQGIGVYKELKSTADYQEKWSILKEYSYLGVISSGDSFDFGKEDEKNNRFNQFYKELEEEGAFLILPSYYYMDYKQKPLTGVNRWGMDGEKVEINRNYLTVNPIYDLQNRPIEISKPKENEISVLIPEKFQPYQEEIIQQLENDYQGSYNINKDEPVQVKPIFVRNNQNYFSFSPQVAAQNNYQIEDPIAVVINYKFDPLILTNSISMGVGFYTKNGNNEFPLQNTQSLIDKYSFTDTWEPVSVAYAQVEDKVTRNKEQLSIISIYCSIYFVLVITLLFFSAIYYLEANKQILALQWIFGYSFFEKHYLVYLFLLVFWNIIFVISFFVSYNISIILPIVLLFAILDFILISFFILLKELQVTKDIIKDK